MGTGCVPLTHHCIGEQKESWLGILVKGVVSSTHSPTSTNNNNNNNTYGEGQHLVGRVLVGQFNVQT